MQENVYDRQPLTRWSLPIIHLEAGGDDLLVLLGLSIWRNILFEVMDDEGFISVDDVADLLTDIRAQVATFESNIEVRPAAEREASRKHLLNVIEELQRSIRLQLPRRVA